MPTQEEMIAKIHEKVTRIETVLLGVPGTQNGGLVGRVNEVCESHYKLKKQFYLLVGILIGLGVLMTGVWTVAEVAGG